MKKGKLHLIPNLLAENTAHKMPQYLKDIIASVKTFYVEELRSARRFMKALDKQMNIDALTFYLLNEHQHEELSVAEKLLLEGQDIAYISEAGCPAVADPGQELVILAHRIGVTVVPHIGPNSLIMALMASGFNGQQFYFHGYLPNKQPQLTNKIKELELHSRTFHCTEIFIETPYRNHQLLSEMVKHCHDNTRVCLAINLTAENETVLSKSVRDWKKTDLNFHKMPAVFLLYAV